jgi:hypothetical protein
VRTEDPASVGPGSVYLPGEFNPARCLVAGLLGCWVRGHAVYHTGYWQKHLACSTDLSVYLIKPNLLLRIKKCAYVCVNTTRG